MADPRVNCSVANCKFWEEENKCNAKSILIEIDRHANDDYDVEAGTLVGEDRHQDQADSVDQTCCHTFRPKGE